MTSSPLRQVAAGSLRHAGLGSLLVASPLLLAAQAPTVQVVGAQQPVAIYEPGAKRCDGTPVVAMGMVNPEHRPTVQTLAPLPASRNPMWGGVGLTPLQAAIIDSIASAGTAEDAPEMVRGRRAKAEGDSATMKAILDAFYRRRDARQAATLSVLTREQRAVYEANVAVRDAGLARAKAEYEARMASPQANQVAQPHLDTAQNHGPRLIPDTLQLPYPASEQGTGVVVASFFIDTKGHVDVPSIVIRSTTSPAFMQAVCTALPTLRFSPAMTRGQPIPALHEQTFTFDPRTANE